MGDPMATAQDQQLLAIMKSQIGPVYGSETLSMLLHVLALRERPLRVLELGTGLGTTTVWIAAAMAQAGQGEIVTIDNGSQFPPDPRNAAFVERFRKIFPGPPDARRLHVGSDRTAFVRQSHNLPAAGTGL